MKSSLYIGLMSGTSLDGIDAALVDFSSSEPRLIGSVNHPIPTDLHAELVALTQPDSDEIDRLGRADVRFSQLQGDAVQSLLTRYRIKAGQVRAIGSHGQTLRHRPEFEPPFTLQIGDPNTLAERTGIDVVADFRRRDMAAGGQGAPLVPAFHADLFRHNSRNRIILNIGGMANITLLPADPDSPVSGFDTGPGNVLMDHSAQHHLGQPYDHNGQWAATGTVNQTLLSLLLGDEYFSMPAPKSTGRERFNPNWLESQLQRFGAPIAPADLQATLLELTARSIADELQRLAVVDPELYICGGGAHNKTLRARLAELLPSARHATTEVLGLHPDWVEATAFAWLAKCFIERRPGNLPAVTGACGPRILGSLSPA